MFKEVYLNGDIENDNVFEVIKTITEHIDKEAKKAKSERTDIRLNICTRGGGCDVGLALCDFLRDINEDKKSPIKVHTHVLRMAYSMGMPIWLCGYNRTISRSGRIMYHDILGWAYGSLEEQKDIVVEGEETVNSINKVITEKSTLTLEELKSIRESRKNKYFEREDALKLLK